jgi:hypothetical protein
MGNWKKSGKEEEEQSRHKAEECNRTVVFGYIFHIPLTTSPVYLYTQRLSHNKLSHSEATLLGLGLRLRVPARRSNGALPSSTSGSSPTNTAPVLTGGQRSGRGTRVAKMRQVNSSREVSKAAMKSLPPSS